MLYVNKKPDKYSKDILQISFKNIDKLKIHSSTGNAKPIINQETIYSFLQNFTENLLILNEHAVLDSRSICNITTGCFTI